MARDSRVLRLLGRRNGRHRQGRLTVRRAPLLVKLQRVGRILQQRVAEEIPPRRHRAPDGVGLRLRQTLGHDRVISHHFAQHRHRKFAPQHRRLRHNRLDGRIQPPQSRHQHVMNVGRQQRVGLRMVAAARQRAVRANQAIFAQIQQQLRGVERVPAAALQQQVHHARRRHAPQMVSRQLCNPLRVKRLQRERLLGHVEQNQRAELPRPCGHEHRERVGFHVQQQLFQQRA